MAKSIILFLLLVTFLKEIVWAMIIPLWQFPDEQSHFGQIAYTAETGKYPDTNENDLTNEILISERLLGTERNEFGINKYTYNPSYRIPYSENSIGLYEKNILDLKDAADGRTMVKRESSKYPSLYYSTLGMFYRLFSENNLIVRVFVIRIIQSFYLVLSIYIIYILGTRVFKNDFYALTLATLVSFQPMLTFVSAGINSDNLGNNMFYLFTLLGVSFLTTKKNVIRYLILFALSSLICIYVKPQYIVTVFIFFIVCIFKLLFTKGSLPKKIFFFMGTCLFLFLTFYLVRSFNLGALTSIDRFFRRNEFLSIIPFFREYVIYHMYREVLPWYWGIYNWLGSTYPRIVHRIINYLILISLLGFGIWIIKNIKKIFTPDKFSVLFLLLCFFSLFVGIYVYDWIEYTETNIHLGVQGRYFFPGIPSVFIIIILGITSLVPKRYRYIALKALIITMILFNFYALYFVSSLYYAINSLQLFITQVSQYKPWFFKDYYVMIILAIYIIFSVKFLLKIVKYEHKSKKQ